MRNALRDAADEIERLRRQLAEAQAEIERLRCALRIIAGQEQCIDNLMSNGDVARATLSTPAPQVAHDEGGGAVAVTEEEIARVLCRQYEIDDGFSEEQADISAASEGYRNFLPAARAVLALFRAAEMGTK
jgi:ribosomal protein L12E/L44/L45/RPP1/RPP2